MMVRLKWLWVVWVGVNAVKSCVPGRSAAHSGSKRGSSA